MKNFYDWVKPVFVCLLIFNSLHYSQIQVEDYITDIKYSSNYSNDQTVFMTVWKSGLFKSTNNGITWVKILDVNDENKWMNVAAVSPTYEVDSTVFAGFRNLFRSTNGGISWDQVTIYAGRVSDLKLSPNYFTDKTLYYIAYQSSKFHRSTDGGDGIWENFPTTDGYLYNWCIEISPNFKNDSTIFLGRLGEGIRRSRDGGITLDSVKLSGKAVYDIVLSSNYLTDHTLFAATNEGLFISEDEGDTWTMQTTIPFSELVLSPNFSNDNMLFGISYEAVVKSTDRGVTWYTADNGIEAPYISCIDISPNYVNDQTLLAGAYERRELYKTTDGGVSWSKVNDDIFGFRMPNITNTPYISEGDPSVVTGTDGIIHAAWLGVFMDSDSIRQEVFYSKYEDGIWDDPVIIDAPTGAISLEYSLAVDDNNQPHLIMRRGDLYLPAQYEDDIYYTFRPPEGNWIEPILVIEGDEDWDTPGIWDENFRRISLSTGVGGKAHILYQTFYGQGYLWYTSNVDGNFLPEPEQVLSDSLNVISSDISIDKVGQVHIAAETLELGLIYANYNNGHFSNLIIISETGKDPIIVTDNNSAVHIAYYISGHIVGYINNKEGSFGEPTFIDYYHQPTMVLDQNGIVHFGMQYGMTPNGWDEPNNEIAYANNLNGSFTDWTLTESYGTIVTANRRYIAVTPDDSVHIIYTMTGNGDIYHLCFYPDNLTNLDDDKLNALPATFKLYQNYPNPFNPITKIKYDIIEKGAVKITVYDILGRKVKSLLNEEVSPGTYELLFDASELASGIYLYRLQTNSYSRTKKMMVLK